MGENFDNVFLRIYIHLCLSLHWQQEELLHILYIQIKQLEKQHQLYQNSEPDGRWWINTTHDRNITNKIAIFNKKSVLKRSMVLAGSTSCQFRNRLVVTVNLRNAHEIDLAGRDWLPISE